MHQIYADCPGGCDAYLLATQGAPVLNKGFFGAAPEDQLQRKGCDFLQPTDVWHANGRLQPVTGSQGILRKIFGQRPASGSRLPFVVPQQAAEELMSNVVDGDSDLAPGGGSLIIIVGVVVPGCRRHAHPSGRAELVGGGRAAEAGPEAGVPGWEAEPLAELRPVPLQGDESGTSGQR